MFRRGPQISRRQMLESVPRLNPEVRWQELDSGRILVAYKKDLRGIAKLVARLVPVPDWSQVLLDAIGSRVIRQMDGTKSVGELMAFVAAEFKLSRKEAEVALLRYLELLGRRNLIGFELRVHEGDTRNP